MKEHIEKFIELLQQLTKEEADLIEIVIKWPDEKKAAYLFAKQMFDEILKSEDAKDC